MEYRSILDRMQDQVLLFQLDGEITYCSLYTQQLFGYSPDELMKMNIEDILVEKSQEYFVDHLESLLLKQSIRALEPSEQIFYAECIRSDGSNFWVEMKGQAWQKEDQVEFLMVMRELVLGAVYRRASIYFTKLEEASKKASEEKENKRSASDNEVMDNRHFAVGNNLRARQRKKEYQEEANQVKHQNPVHDMKPRAPSFSSTTGSLTSRPSEPSFSSFSSASLGSPLFQADTISPSLTFAQQQEDPVRPKLQRKGSKRSRYQMSSTTEKIGEGGASSWMAQQHDSAQQALFSAIMDKIPVTEGLRKEGPPVNVNDEIMPHDFMSNHSEEPWQRAFPSAATNQSRHQQRPWPTFPPQPGGLFNHPWASPLDSSYSRQSTSLTPLVDDLLSLRAQSKLPSSGQEDTESSKNLEQMKKSSPVSNSKAVGTAMNLKKMI